ncbi:MAG: hypothetical protein R3B46_04705 [Phycisphaerales bacterium]
MLKRVGNTTRYVFDPPQTPSGVPHGGFFPINNNLFGNYKNTGKNFHFTTELATRFVYNRGADIFNAP